MAQRSPVRKPSTYPCRTPNTRCPHTTSSRRPRPLPISRAMMACATACASRAAISSTCMNVRDPASCCASMAGPTPRTPPRDLAVPTRSGSPESVKRPAHGSRRIRLDGMSARRSRGLATGAWTGSRESAGARLVDVSLPAHEPVRFYLLHCRGELVQSSHASRQASATACAGATICDVFRRAAPASAPRCVGG